MRITVVIILLGVLLGCATLPPDYDAEIQIGPSKTLGHFTVVCTVSQNLHGKPSRHLGTVTNTVKAGLEEMFLVCGKSDDDGVVCSVIVEQDEGHMMGVYLVSVNRDGRKIWSATQQILLVPFAQWQPDETNRHTLPPKLLSPDMQISGEWFFTDNRYFGTDLTFLPSRNGYIADFHAWGCTGKSNLARRAVFAKGIVRLSEPVTDFWTNTYQELYAVRIGERDFLVPSCVAKEFEDGLNLEDTAVTNLAWHVLQRLPEQNKN